MLRKYKLFSKSSSVRKMMFHCNIRANIEEILKSGAAAFDRERARGLNLEQDFYEKENELAKAKIRDRENQLKMRQRQISKQNESHLSRAHVQSTQPSQRHQDPAPVGYQCIRPHQSMTGLASAMRSITGDQGSNPCCEVVVSPTSAQGSHVRSSQPMSQQTLCVHQSVAVNNSV